MVLGFIKLYLRAHKTVKIFLICFQKPQRKSQIMSLFMITEKKRFDYQSTFYLILYLLSFISLPVHIWFRWFFFFLFIVLNCIFEWMMYAIFCNHSNILERFIAQDGNVFLRWKYLRCLINFSQKMLRYFYGSRAHRSISLYRTLLCG